MVDFISPVTWEYKVSSVLGDPRSYGEHEGIDLVPKTASSILPVVAAAAGKVIESGYMADGYGYWVKLQHADGYQTIYGHFSGDPLVKKGDQVFGGQIIGNAGSSGNSTGTHLHYSILKDGSYLNPLEFVRGISEAVNTAASALESLFNSLPEQSANCGERPATLGSNPDDIRTYASCVEKYLTGDALVSFQEAVKEWIAANAGNEKRDGGLLGNIVDFGPLTDWLDNMLKDIMIQFLNLFTWPSRMYINTLHLSDPAVTNGLETMGWLREPEHQQVYIVSMVAIIIAVAFILLAIASFLKEPVLEIANPASAVVGTVKK